MPERSELARPDLQKLYQDTLRSLNGEPVFTIDSISANDPDAFPGDIVADALKPHAMSTEKRVAIVYALEDFYDSAMNETRLLVLQSPLSLVALPDNLQKRLKTMARVLDLAHPPELEQRTEQTFEFALGLLEKEHGPFVEDFALDAARSYLRYPEADNYAQLWEQASISQNLWLLLLRHF